MYSLIIVDFGLIFRALMSLMKVVIMVWAFSNALYLEITGYGGLLVVM